ncbi:hypothetical protein C8J57DRAFT_1246419 [Mycena rebaudengoi]|nr:hypothetical protein C8J57DRAFT_1246419 [Mycena rebaudengoi]
MRLKPAQLRLQLKISTLRHSQLKLRRRGFTAQTSTAPWTPTAENLVVKTTAPQGEPSIVGWIFPSVDGTDDGTPIFDGFVRKISIFFKLPYFHRYWPQIPYLQSKI